jgi:hypothetical protein
MPGIAALPPAEPVRVRPDPVGNGTDAAMSSKVAKVAKMAEAAKV